MHYIFSSLCVCFVLQSFIIISWVLLIVFPYTLSLKERPSPSNYSNNCLKMGWNSTYICPIHRQRFVKITQTSAQICSRGAIKRHRKRLRKFQPSSVFLIYEKLSAAVPRELSNISSTSEVSISPTPVATPSIGRESIKSSPRRGVHYLQVSWVLKSQLQTSAPRSQCSIVSTHLSSCTGNAHTATF